MENNPSTPVFADRYRFESVGNDWDRGRSGYTHLVYDLKEKRLGVIKRAELTSKEAVEGLKNEVAALRALHGLGVPEVYETGETLYGSKNYGYMVIEYIDALRVEKNLHALSSVERIEIITKLFEILSRSHQKGIVNGDVDLKHLFWRREKKQLIIFDWGNAKHGVDQKNKTEFTYDLIRSAEIVFSLIVRSGRLPITGPLTLPDDSALNPKLAPVPSEIRGLCGWARTHSNGAKVSPYTAVQLLGASRKWLNGQSSDHQGRKKPSLVMTLALVISCFVFLAVAVFMLFKSSILATETPIVTVPSSTVLPPTEFPTVNEPTDTPPTSMPTVAIASETSTLQPVVIPSPESHSQVLAFDNQLLPYELRTCLNSKNTLISPSEVAKLKDPEGLYRSFVADSKEDWWIFSVDRIRSVEEVVQTEFQSCVDVQKIDAVAVNAWVTWLEPRHEGAPEKEFGFFLEDNNGKRREYTIWMDSDKKMHLRLRENDIVTDNDISVVSLSNLQSDGTYPAIYYKFPIQIFLELNNDGLDILYLREAPYAAVQDFDPSEMTRIDGAVLPAFGNAQKVGLMGRGGLTKVIIWPLIFFGR